MQNGNKKEAPDGAKEQRAPRAQKSTSSSSGNSQAKVNGVA